MLDEPILRPAPSHRGWVMLLAIAGVAVLATVISLAYTEWRLDAEQRHAAETLLGGDASKAPALIRRFGCAGCHIIPGVPAAVGLVGPELKDVSRRVFIGGVAVSTPESLIKWIVDPRAIDPKSAMPRTGISREEARDVATYLMSLR
jgi:cytochrome c